MDTATALSSTRTTLKSFTVVPPNVIATMLTGLGIDEYFARTDPNGTMSYLTDMLGSTIPLADSSGAITTQYSYDPFGNTTVSGSSTNPLQFTMWDQVVRWHHRCSQLSPPSSTISNYIKQRFSYAQVGVNRRFVNRRIVSTG